MAKALLATLPTPPTAATARRPGTTSSTSTWAALQPAVTAAWQNGVYRRDFQNSIVRVNPHGNGTQTVTLAGTSHKILGTQDPATNNDQAATSVTLKAADDLVLTR